MSRPMVKSEMSKPKSVNAYIATAPKEARSKLKELRSVIRKTAPTALEQISYGIPCYAYKGPLAYFGLWKSHIGLYLPTPIIEEHKRELAAYETTSATIRLPLDKRLPVVLIRKLVRARIKKNDEEKNSSGR